MAQLKMELLSRCARQSVTSRSLASWWKQLCTLDIRQTSVKSKCKITGTDYYPYSTFNPGSFYLDGHTVWMQWKACCAAGCQWKQGLGNL